MKMQIQSDYEQYVAVYTDNVKKKIKTKMALNDSN